MNALKRVNREKGATLLGVEQKIDFSKQLAQKFFIMEKGVSQLQVILAILRIHWCGDI